MIAPFFPLGPNGSQGFAARITRMGHMEKMSDNLPQTIGFDISKASLDCYVHLPVPSAILLIPPRATGL